MSSIRFVKSRTLMLPLSQPRRHLTVTGTSTALTTLETIWPASSGVRIRPHPSPELAIFGMGQPMLMSMKSQPEISNASLAPSAMVSGSLPKICAPQMLPSFFRRSLALFLSLYTSAREETISVTVTPAPNRAQIVRKAQSVTPAMGARKSGLSTWMDPISMFSLSFKIIGEAQNK